MRWIVGWLLIVASMLKATGPIIAPETAVVSPLGSWFPPVQAGLELGLGLIVLSGIYWRLARWVVLLLFVGFAAYTLHLALAGAASCGCFGPLKVHPWWTFLLDLAIVLGLLLSILFGRSGSTNSLRFQMPRWISAPATIAVVMAVSTVGATILVRYANSRVAVAGDSFSIAHGLVVLEPEEWIGQKLPIANSIDLDLSQGDWTVLLHRHDCPVCQAAVPRYEQRAFHERVALMEVPPYGESHADTSSPALRGRLSDNRQWFVQTPVELQLRDGVVIAVKNEHEQQ